MTAKLRRCRDSSGRGANGRSDVTAVGSATATTAISHFAPTDDPGGGGCVVGGGCGSWGFSGAPGNP